VEPYSEFRRLRKELRLSQWGLARLSGIPYPTIHRTENGQQKPCRGTLSKLADALDVAQEWLSPTLSDLYEYPVGIKLTPKVRDATMPYISPG
jgi:transcriptional regulator with XRE-family HTH domain